MKRSDIARKFLFTFQSNLKDPWFINKRKEGQQQYSIDFSFQIKESLRHY